MCDDERIYEIEHALGKLGMEKCEYCNGWYKKHEIKEYKFSRSDVHNHWVGWFCPNCKEEREKQIIKEIKEKK